MLRQSIPTEVFCMTLDRPESIVSWGILVVAPCGQFHSPPHPDHDPKNRTNALSPNEPSIMNHGNHSSGPATFRETRTFDL